MKKIMFIFVLVVFLLMPVTSLADELTATELVGNIETSIIDDFDTVFLQEIKTKNLNKFMTLKSIVNKINYDDEDISAYNYFISSQTPSVEEISYVNALITKGYPIQTITQIYEYWKDTAEDLSVIELICRNIPADYETNPYWVDDAFLSLSKQGKTKVTFSDLSVSKVREYIESGYTYEDLIFAERLSRKGVMSIEKILEERIAGKDWNDILSTVYNMDFSQATVEQIESMNLSAQTLKIVDFAISECSQAISNENKNVNSLYIDKIFSGYNEFVANSKIIRDLKF